jgi:predicted transcriptional regulator
MKPKRRKVVMNVSLSPEVMELLATEAERQDRSRSWLIERAVKEVFGAEAAQANAQWEALKRLAPQLVPTTVGMARETEGLPE